MTMSLETTRLARVSDAIARRMGLHFPPERYPDLRRGLEAVAAEQGFEDVWTCGRWLTHSSHTRLQIEMLASHLTVGETYFFRDPAVFGALRETVLPTLIAERRETTRRLRFWSAGCSTGEEAYSLAMVLDALLPDRSGWDITLLATDINPHVLHGAREGVYREWSFRECPAEQKSRYFESVGQDRNRIRSAIRHMVTFEYLNLAEDSYPALLSNTHAMDLILCRNVLMYFTPVLVERTVSRFARCLVDGGCLAVSSSEAWLVSGQGFKPHTGARARIYQRHEVQRPRERAPGSAAPSLAGAGDGLLRKRRDPPVAVGTVPRVTGATASDADVLAQAGTLYVRGEYADVLRLLVPLAKRLPAGWSRPQTAEAVRIVALSYANRGELDEAEKWCRAAIRRQHRDSSLHYLLAMVLQEQGHLARARRCLEATLMLDRDFVLAHFGLGVLAEQRGDSRAAHCCFEKATRLLRRMDPAAIVPASEGIPAGRLIEIICEQEEVLGVPSNA